MAEVLGSILGLAVGIAISPVPIAAVILMTLSGRARANSLAFLVAWVAGIAVVTMLAASVPGLEADDGAPSAAAGWAKLGLGVLLALAGLRQWRNRPGPDQEPDGPGWMTRIDELRPIAAAGLGLALSAVNPKNLLLAVAAGATIGAAGLSLAQRTATVASFTAIAAATVIAPVIAYLAASDRLAPTLERSKDWLIANNATVMAVLFGVFSAKLLGDGIAILAT